MRIRVFLAAAIAAWAVASTALAELPQIIGDNAAAAELRKRMIRDARPSDEIAFTTFNFYLDPPVREMIKLLGDTAARRTQQGNRTPITVVVDGHFVDNTPGSGGYPAYELLVWLANQGVRAYVYNPLRPLASNASSTANLWINHRKILVVGTSVLLGSRNAGSYHLEDFHREGSSNFIDADLYTPPGLAPNLAADSIAMVRGMTTEPGNSIRIRPEARDFGQVDLPPKVAVAAEKIWGNALEGTFDWRLYRTDWPRQLDPRALSNALAECSLGTGSFIESLVLPNPTLLGGCVKVVMLLTADFDRDEARRAIRQAIHDEPSRGEILVETPYFYPDQETIAEITSAIRRNVRFHLITNSVYTSGGLSKLILIYMDPVFQEWRGLGGDRVNIEFSNEHNIHAKSFSFRSQRLFFAGSHNLHPRSGLFDTESVVSFRADREDFMNLRTWYYQDYEAQYCRKAGHSAQILVSYSPVDFKALQHVLDALPEAVDWMGAPSSVTSAVRKVAGALRGRDSLNEFPEKPGEWKITRAHRYLEWIAERNVRAVAIRKAFGALEPLVGPFL